MLTRTEGAEPQRVWVVPCQSADEVDPLTLSNIAAERAREAKEQTELIYDISQGSMQAIKEWLLPYNSHFQSSFEPVSNGIT